MTDDFIPTDWITTAEAAELSGYSPAHVRRLANRDLVEARKLAHAWLVERENLYAALLLRLYPS